MCTTVDADAITPALHTHAHTRQLCAVAAANTCTAKADAAAWAAVGCVVASGQAGTTVSALGSQSAAPGYQSCAITCPTKGSAFTVNAPGV